MTTSSDRPNRERPDEAAAAGSLWGSQPPALSGCELLDSVAAELALGSLAGAERSAALAHLDDCQACRQLVEELTAAADSLLLIAAEADPPAGFEVRLLERLKAAGGTAASASAPGTAAGGPFPLPVPEVRRPDPVGDRRAVEGAPVSSINDRANRSAHRFNARARVMLAVAAVALAAAGVGLGFEVAPRNAPVVSAVGAIRLSSLHATGASAGSRTAAGEVVITTGRQSWLLMTVNLHATGWVTCEVGVNGQEVAIGGFELYGGRGSWAAPLHHSGAAVTSARIVDSSGQVLASADLQA